MTAIRHYIVTEKGLRRLNLNVINRKAALPQFAGTRQKVVEVRYEWRGNRLFLKAIGSRFTFDTSGLFGVPREDLKLIPELMSTDEAIRRERTNNPKVANMELHRRSRRLKSEEWWDVPEEDRRAIAADLLGPARPAGTRAIPFLKS
jgi:hypothetical protein